MPTFKQIASNNYSVLGHLSFPRRESGCETGSRGDQGRDLAVPVEGHHWKPLPKLDSSSARVQQYMIKTRGSLLPGSFWKNDRITEKKGEQQEHLSMAYFYFCPQKAVYYQCSWVYKLVNLLYRKVTFWGYNYFLILNMIRRLNAKFCCKS